MKKLLNIKKGSLDFGKKVAQFFFLKITENTNLKKKIRYKKKAILSYFFIEKISSKTTPLIYLLKQI